MIQNLLSVHMPRSAMFGSHNPWRGNKYVVIKHNMKAERKPQLIFQYLIEASCRQFRDLWVPSILNRYSDLPSVLLTVFSCKMLHTIVINSIFKFGPPAFSLSLISGVSSWISTDFLQIYNTLDNFLRSDLCHSAGEVQWGSVLLVLLPHLSPAAGQLGTIPPSQVRSKSL